MMRKKITAKDIKIMAVKAGFTMDQVCRMAGVTHSTFSRWYKGHSVITEVALNKILAVFEEIRTP